MAGPFPVTGLSPVSEPSPVAVPLPAAVPLRVAGPPPVSEPLPAAGSAPAGPSATGAGTGTSGADSTWTYRAGEETTVIVLFSGGLELLGDSLTSRLVTYVGPVWSAPSRLLSWLGRDLRSRDARDELDERDWRSPEEWWWCREEEADGWVSDALETLPDSARLRELEPPEELGWDCSLSRREPSRRDDWCLGESWRLSSPCLRLRSGLLDLRQSDPWELGRPTTETLEAMDLGWEDSDVVALVFVRFILDDPPDVERLEGSWIASSGACISTESSMVSSAFLAAFATAAALRQFLWALAFSCAAHASGNQSLQTRQGLSWVQSDCPSLRWHCWQRRWLSFLRRKCKQPGNLGWDSADDDLSRECSSAILSTQVRLERRKHMASHVTYLPKLSPEPADELQRQPLLSSIFVFDLNAWEGHRYSEWLDSRPFTSEAKIEVNDRRMWCSAQVRLRMDVQGTQFHCVKFRLGSAGEPTICSHCYDVLNEDVNYQTTIHWNGKAVSVTTLIFTENAEDTLQRLQWIPGLSHWWSFPFCLFWTASVLNSNFWKQSW